MKDSFHDEPFINFPIKTSHLFIVFSDNVVFLTINNKNTSLSNQFKHANICVSDETLSINRQWIIPKNDAIKPIENTIVSISLFFLKACSLIIISPCV